MCEYRILDQIAMRTTKESWMRSYGCSVWFDDLFTAEIVCGCLDQNHIPGINASHAVNKGACSHKKQIASMNHSISNIVSTLSRPHYGNVSSRPGSCFDVAQR